MRIVWGVWNETFFVKWGVKGRALVEMPALRLLRFWAVGIEIVSKKCPSTIIFEPELFE